MHRSGQVTFLPHTRFKTKGKSEYSPCCILHSRDLQRKAKAARSEQEGDGASDIEALFASAEDAKPPTVLAAGAGS
ncbi:hypothetical protein ACIGHG_03210 [Bacillus sp. NPDC077411]|uniref:hypothetical protein n=1 Tax=Bacillus sp. NPDC077411 TaxID=3363947 RepID=UPI0037C6A054